MSVLIKETNKEIPFFIDLLIKYSSSCMQLLHIEQDSYLRFLYCCSEKIFKSFISIKSLYSLLEADNSHEFTLGIIFRSLLMDAILCQRLKFLTIKFNNTNHLEIKNKLLEDSYKFVADGSGYIVESIYSNEQISEEEKAKTIQNIVNQFPGVFYYDNEKGRYKINSAFRLSLSDVYKSCDSDDLQIRKKVYDLYCYYSKYDHVSHWTSIAGNIEEAHRLNSLQSSIVMLLLNFNDLLRTALFHEKINFSIAEIVKLFDKDMDDIYKAQN